MTGRVAVDFDLGWRAPRAWRGGLRVIAIVFLATMAACSSSRAANQPSASASGLTETGQFTTPEAVGLKVYSNPWNFGIRCPLWWDRHAMVVPASGDANYKPGDVSRLANYANARVAFKPGAGEPPALPEDLLREVNGSATSAAAPLQPGITGKGFYPTCAFQLEVTNVGNSAVQISKVGVSLTAQPEPNQETYRLIDMCSLAGIPHYCGPQLGGGGAPCSFYTAQVELTDVKPGALSQQPPLAIAGNGGECPAMVVNPAQTLDLRVDLWSGKNLIFPVEPILTVATPAGEKVVAIPAQAGRAAFASASQFTCLKFQANTFVAAYEGSAALDLQQQAPKGSWCL